MASDDHGVTPIREITTSDANVLTGLFLVAAALFDMVWLLCTAVAIPSFPKPVSVAVAAVVFFAAIFWQVFASRRAALSFDDETVWWITGLRTLHHVPIERVRFDVRRRFGIDQATIANGDDAPVVVPRLVVITFVQPVATVAVRELDPVTGKPREWVDLGLRWTELRPNVLEQTLSDREAFTYAIANAPKH